MQVATSIGGSNRHPLQMNYLSTGTYFSLTQLGIPLKWQPDKYHEYLNSDHLALSQNRKRADRFQRKKLARLWLETPTDKWCI